MCRSCRRSRRWCCAAAQSGNGHRIRGTTCACGNFAYYEHERLAIFDVKRERCRVTWNRALPFVSYPVGADVIWIKRSQVSSREDEIATLAVGIDIDCHALGGAGRVCERVGIVMDRSSGDGKTCTGTGAEIRKTVAVKAISLCGISIVDVSNNHGRWAGRRRRRAGRGRRRAPTACATAIDIKHVVHGAKKALHWRRNRIAAIWRAEVAKPRLGIWVRPDNEEIVLSGLIRRQHFHHQLERPGRHGSRQRHVEYRVLLIWDADFS